MQVKGIFLYSVAKYDLITIVDVIPLNLSLRFETIAAQYPNAHLWISRDVSTLVNTGCMILRNTQWLRSFLYHWVAQRTLEGVINEQLGFERVIALYAKQEIERKIKIFPISILNSEAPAMGKQLPHHQVYIFVAFPIYSLLTFL